jgi:hypothetical protein
MINKQQTIRRQARIMLWSRLSRNANLGMHTCYYAYYYVYVCELIWSIVYVYIYIYSRVIFIIFRKCKQAPHLLHTRRRSQSWRTNSQGVEPNWTQYITNTTIMRKRAAARRSQARAAPFQHSDSACGMCTARGVPVEATLLPLRLQSPFPAYASRRSLFNDVS